MSARAFVLLAAVVAAMSAAPGARASEDGPVGRAQRVEHVPSSMVTVPGGTFEMGFPAADEERANLLLACRREFGEDPEGVFCRDEVLWHDARDVRDVYLPGFDIDRYEVTVDAFRACAAAGGCDGTALLSGAVEHLGPGLPMANVTWQDAADYCEWAGKRLPTEAEWEKAARGTDARRWPWGNHNRRDGANHGRVEPDMLRVPVTGTVEQTADDSDGARYAVAPGTMKWSDGPYGAYDLAGNVSEWVADYYQETYAGLTTIAPEVSIPLTNFSMRVVRGGSWAEPRMYGRTYFRRYANPESRSFDRGFRCARDQLR